MSEYFRRADVAGLSWPLPDDLCDTALEHRLCPHEPRAFIRDIPQPNWVYVHSKLRRKGVTGTMAKGSVEDLNKRPRRYLPGGTQLATA